MLRTTSAALSVAYIASVATAAHTVELKKVDTGKGSNVKIQFGTIDQNVFAGELMHKFRNGVGDGAQFNGFTLPTYCIEVTEEVTTSYQQYDVTNDISGLPVPQMGADRAAAVQRMFALLIDIKNGAGTFDDNTSAGFQVAVWEVVYDYDAGAGRSSTDVGAGSLIIKNTNGSPLSSAVKSKADMFLDVVGTATSGTLPQVWGFHRDGKQDQIVPTPAAGMLAGVGLLAAARRRRRN